MVQTSVNQISAALMQLRQDLDEVRQTVQTVLTTAPAPTPAPAIHVTPTLDESKITHDVAQLRREIEDLRSMPAATLVPSFDESRITNDVVQLRQEIEELRQNEVGQIRRDLSDAREAWHLNLHEALDELRRVIVPVHVPVPVPAADTVDGQAQEAPSTPELVKPKRKPRKSPPSIKKPPLIVDEPTFDEQQIPAIEL